MPVGTGFENSAMKASFSLSSLQPSQETPDKGVKVRTCNSLTKKKHAEDWHWRRSWGSTGGSTASEQKDDFWSALQANYDYIMDNQLIDNCQEANGELTLDSHMWSLKEFYIQFSELYSWLNSVQETLGKELGNSEEYLKTRYTNEIVKKNPILKLFNEQASQLVQLHPEMEEEVTWRVMRLNSKWELMEAALGLSDCRNCHLHTCTDIEHELKRLRSWMKNMESRLQPLVFRVKWSKADIENKTLEHKVLHRDIESHGKIVSSVVKLSKGHDGVEGVNVRRIARSLERRWHLLFLRSLEWQCYIDCLSKNLVGENRTTFTESSDSENDDEPLKKYPRLGDSFCSSRITLTDDERLFLEGKSTNNEKDDGNSADIIATMVKPTFIEEKQKKTKPKISELLCLTPDRLKSPDDTSAFTKSNRRAPNLGTYYFKHEDTTDSEIQTSNSSKLKAITTIDDSSEDEWTYTTNTKKQVENKCNVTVQNNHFPVLKSSCQDIRRLVQEAEELVRESPVKKIKSSTGAPLNKMSRVKQWLNMDKPTDSCDASCEEEEKESQSSEDLNESVATCRAPHDILSQSMIANITDVDKVDLTPKVLLRQRRVDLKRDRPWSISCIPQLPYALPRSGKAQNFSISESALHQLNLSPKCSKSLAASANSISQYQNHSTSSTMEEGGTTLVEHNSTPVRRRRLKFRRKSSSRRRGSNEPCYTMESPRERVGTLTKSESFSGSTYKITNIERHTVSDPSTIHHGQQYPLSTNTSDAESNEDGHNKGMPMFKIGAATSYLSGDLRDNSPGKGSINATEEQSSSLSEQAWDSYQEKYLSEAYSEAQDSDAARRLLEFGEDYRNFLDSQSDWSTQSTNPEVSPPFKRKILSPFDVLESESDYEDVRHLLKQSCDELLNMVKLYNQQFAIAANDHLNTSVSDIIATCDRHLYCLTLIEKSPEEYSLSKIDRERSADLLLQWKRLKEKANRMQEYRNLQKEIIILKDELVHFKIPPPFEFFNSIDDIRKEIEFYSAKLANVEERKGKLLTLNVAVHRFVIENKHYNPSALKGDINELYRVWYDIHTSATERLNHLRCLLQTWQTLESRLEQLQGDLQEDKETLIVLDSALRDGILSDNIATSVRDVAKVLSETNQGFAVPGLLSESSFSDSGISDEGSEHELGERERRLASIQHLMRQLESTTAPNSFARINMNERFLAAEDELRSLQKRCRSLVVLTAVNAVSPPPGEPSSVVFSDPGDPEDKSGSGSWFKRVVRASVPFQLAIVALLCVACLLEPHCCDNMNTFSMSLTPQLRYVRGPPPV